MKITKWFLLAALALLCCACAKNDPLAYVDEDADVIWYFNLTDEINDDIWDEYISGKLKGFGAKDDELMGVDLKKNPAKIAYWKKYDRSEKKDGKTVRKMVIVFSEYEAEKFLNEAAAWYEGENKKYKIDDEKIDGLNAKVIKTKTFKNGKETYEIEATLIAADKKVVQIIFSDEKVSSALKPEKKCKAAKNIDNDAVYARATSASWNKYEEEQAKKAFEEMKKRSPEKYKNKEYTVLDIGDTAVNMFIKGDEIVTESTVDVEKLVD